MSTRNDACFVSGCDILDENVALRQSQWPRSWTEVRGFFTLDGEKVQARCQRFGHGVPHPEPRARARLPGGARDGPRLLAAETDFGASRDGLAAPREPESDPLPAQLPPVRGARDHFLPHVAALRHR